MKRSRVDCKIPVVSRDLQATLDRDPTQTDVGQKLLARLNRRGAKQQEDSRAAPREKECKPPPPPTHTEDRVRRTLDPEARGTDKGAESTVMLKDGGGEESLATHVTGADKAKETVDPVLRISGGSGVEQDDDGGVSGKIQLSGEGEVAIPTVADLAEDYLRIDQSKVPISWFDCVDAGPDDATMLASCSSGRSPFYANGAWQWRRCDILSYDPFSRQFTIRYRHWPEDRTKQVQRLNLIFDNENKAAFQNRVRQAHRLRETAKTIVRFEHFVACQPTDRIQRLSDERIDAIYKLACRGNGNGNSAFSSTSLSSGSDTNRNSADKNSSSRGTAELQSDGLPGVGRNAPLSREALALRRTLVDDIDGGYINAMQKAIIFHAYKFDESLRQRYAALRLPELPTPAPTPYTTLVALPPGADIASLWRARDVVASRHVSKYHGLLKTLSWLEDTWEREFEHAEFFLTARSASCWPSAWEPLNVSAFHRVQVQHCVDLANGLKNKWRDGMANELVDGLQSEFHFYVDERAKYERSGLADILKLVDLRMADQLFGLCMRSVNAWVAFLEAYAEVAVHEQSNNEGEGEEDTGSRNDEAKAQTSLATPSSARGIATSPSSRFFPLVEAVVSRNGKTVTCTPSLGDFEHCCLDVLAQMVDVVLNLTSVDHSLMSLLSLEPRPILPFKSHSPRVVMLNASMEQAKTRISAAVRKIYEPVECVVRAFQCKATVLGGNPKGALNEFLASLERQRLENLPVDGDGGVLLVELEEHPSHQEDKTAALAPFRSEIAKYAEETGSVQQIANDDVQQGIFLVRSGSLKSDLSERGAELMAVFAQHAYEMQRHEAREVTVEYERIMKRLEEKPKTEEELVALEAYMTGAEAHMAKLMANVDAIHGWFSMLDEYSGERVSQADFFLFWTLKRWPMWISDARLGAKNVVEEEKQRMIDALALEKIKFEEDLDQCSLQVDGFMGRHDPDQTDAIIAEAYAINDKLTEATEMLVNFNKRDAAFGFDTSEYPILDDAKKRYEPFFSLWSMTSDFKLLTQRWTTGPFIELEANEVESQVTNWWTASYRLMKQFAEEHPGVAEVAERLREDSDTFRKYLPIVRSLASPALRDRHWASLSELIQVDVIPDEALTLQQLLDLNIMDHWEQVETITVVAEKEFALESAIQSMEAEWEGVAFGIVPYKESGTFIVRGTDDVLALLDDHVVRIQTMLGSPYIKPIIDHAKRWERNLLYTQNLIDELLKTQRAWMYLEPIFGSEDIMRQMPTEGRRFAAVDNMWKKTMASAVENPVVMDVSANEKLHGLFVQANEKLELIQKGLSDYLEVKRMAFARFFFLSNDELLEILSQTKDPTAVQPFLGKCFEGCARVVFAYDMPPESRTGRGEPLVVTAGREDVRICRLESNEGELVDLSIIVDPNTPANRGNVEQWLGELELSMRITIKEVIVKAADAYPVMQNFEPNPERKKWVLSWPGQVVLNAGQLFWTQEVTSAIEQGKLVKYTDALSEQLNQIVHLVRGKLNKMERTTLGALCVIDLHQRDVIQEMADAGVSDPNAFEWMAQLRYYWEEHDDDFHRYGKNPWNMMVRILNATQMYAYEYLGNSSRLVITPLTDRCYRTLMGAVSLMYGGAPAGPAGTGKTETTKDLSKAIAKQCVVFNCSDGLDYLAMAKFFKGLAQAGAWACFDEFNRIELEVLSVIAQQILTIQNAKRSRAKQFDFEGSILTLNPDANCFITMNPGYAGRQELPDNLQALFRPCAMMVPNYALIAEIKLFAFGFMDARNMARKLTQVLTLCSEQLSSQKHYDYGMRAVFSILVRAGFLRQTLGDVWTEEMLVLSAVTDVNLPKFTTNDIPLFKGICSDLFPGVVLPVPDYGDLIPAIKRVCEEDGLQAEDAFVRAVVQLYETVMVRHGLMVVGQTLSGKTCVARTLAKAMSSITGDPRFEPNVNIHVINPKSITQGQLYGNFDENTHEWTDGILAVTYRSCAKDTSGDRQWIMFDGPVDAVWIEDMNTVLDDNKKLCLQSGEIVKMSNMMTMMFETENLDVASPATVSRVGMVFLEQKRLGWRPLVRSWVDAMPDAIKAEGYDEVLLMFEQYFEPMVFLLRNSCKTPTPVTDSELAASMLRLLSSLLLDLYQEGAEDQRPKDALKCVEGCFLLSLVWAIGGVTDASGRRSLDAFLKRLLTNTLDGRKAWTVFVQRNPSYADVEWRTLRMPMPFEEGSAFDYCFLASKCVWVPWEDLKDKFVIPAGAPYQSILVPTVDTVRNGWIIQRLVEHNMPVLCTGSTGTGKTVTLQRLLTRELDGNKYKPMFLNFSAQTSANQTQDIIDSKLDKRRRGVFGPPMGKRCVIMVDDLNMPAKETYGAQPPIEILRQYMDHDGWYDRKDNTFRKLVDIQFVAAMGPPGGGRSQITQRYVRHFCLINFLPFDGDGLAVVFSTIMDWFLRPFNPKVKSVSAALVAATIGMYAKIEEEMLPTPAKSHYTFNLRDLSKVFQGMCMGSHKHIETKEQLIRLWGHECIRVFHDRLVSHEDREWFFHALGEKTTEFFNVEWIKVAPRNKPLIYGNFADEKALVESRVYNEIDDHDHLRNVMGLYLQDHNNMSSKKMDLVLFMNAIEHVARIARVLCQTQGNALLVGVGGSGRKSVTTLAVSVCQQHLFQIEISNAYGMVEWHDDLKRMLRMAGEEGKQTVFLFSDTQVVNEGFVEDINNILNTGEVPNLFQQDELQEIAENVRVAASKEGVVLNSPVEVFSYFVSQCRTNLHVVLAFSPVGDDFRNRLRMFPSLVNCCAIDWFTEWPKEALRSVANHFLSTLSIDESIKAGVVDVCVDMQERTDKTARDFLAEMGRYYYVTPTSYLELINTFKVLVQSKHEEIFTKRARYENGLSKLRETAEQVAEMRVELEALQPKLVVAQKETDEKLVVVQEQQDAAATQQVQVEKDATAANEKAAACAKDKAECEEMLAEAIPALEGAVKALKTLSKGDIVEVKSMSKPPPAVVLTMEAVCLMMKVKPKKVPNPNGRGKIDDFWEPAKKELLGDAKFLTRLMEYDKDNIAPAIIEKVAPFCEREEFNPDVVKKSSVAAAGLCKWVHAMVTYEKIARVVAPKRAALEQANSDLELAMNTLKRKQDELQVVLDNVAQLKRELQATMDFKEALENQVKDCATKLDRASRLIGGLGGEKTRWTTLVAELTVDLTNVVGDVLLSSGVVAYMGPFTSLYREGCVQDWSGLLSDRNIPSTTPFRLATVLGEPVKIREWTIMKLPNDLFSVDNAIMLTSSNRWPLMIDPQGQANRWVRNMEEVNDVKVVKQSQGGFVRMLENAISFGVPVLIENVQETLDPVLEPLLTKQIVTRAGASTIQLGDSTIEYNHNFRLYMTTKLSNPHYAPEVCVKVNLLNFMATQEGLQDQMLAITVKRETPELEKKRQQLVVEDAENKRILKEIEDKILELLAKAEGNILDDEELINTLSESKVTSNNIMMQVKVAEKTQAKIQEARKSYEPVAIRVSNLFFCVSDVAVVDPMYQFSLEWYTQLFNLAIDRAETSSNLSTRLDALCETFARLLYQNVCRSLFEKDKLLFSFLLCIKILQISNDLDSQELRFLLTGSVAVDLSRPNPCDEGWLSDKSWGDFLGLAELPAMQNIDVRVEEDLVFWKKVFNSPDPQEDLDERFGDEYTTFQRMLLLRCLRMDKVVPAIQNFIMHSIGKQFIEPPPFDLVAGFNDSTCTTPLLFILTPGADPMTELLRMAASMDMQNKLFSVSLGQGQGPIAERAILEAIDNGSWVCLQNCHVATSWLPTLEKLCEDLSPERTHENFRLFLTAQPCKEFPVSVLQNGIKITLEPPRGFRANLTGSYISMDVGWFESCPKSREFKKLLFGICFFHALVRERCRFGALGWNIPYTFSVPDLRITMDQLHLFLSEYDEIPFKMLRYLAGECNYGGRVTDNKDRRCLLSTLEIFYTEKILDDDYKFSPSGTYFAPRDGNHASYLEYIKTLPYNEGPEVFGLHDNADITSAIKGASSLLSTTLALQPRTTGGSGKSWAETLMELACDIESKMPALFDIERAMVMYPVKFEESMNTVLVQELGRFNSMLQVIKTSLRDVQLAIKGFVLMSKELEDMGNAMTSMHVPEMWKAVAYPSLKPLGSWVNDLLQRIQFLSSWMENGKPSVYWISGFYFIPGFLTGTRQNYARKHTIPIDLIRYDFRMLTFAESKEVAARQPGDPANAKEDGAFIDGLFLEGANWCDERGVLVESTPKELFVTVPVVQLIPYSVESDHKEPEHRYECPVYKTSERFGVLSTTGHSTNFVINLQVPMLPQHEESHWIRRGVAMLTQLDS